MPEPLTLAAVGAVVLTEGIKFLYGQATKILDRWRDRRDAAAKGQTPAQTEAAPLPADAPRIFEGQLTPLVIHFDAVEKAEEQLRALRKELSDYADGYATVDPNDERVVAATDAVRRLLEAIYQQRITFKGESRPTSGPVVEGEVKVDEVLGYVAAVRARVIASGHVSAHAEATKVGSEGTLIGVDVDTIGTDSPPTP